MCGRYFIDTDFMEILKKYHVEKSSILEEHSPGEVFPGTNCLIIRQGTQRRGDMLHWGMPYPFLSKPIINVRMESMDKPMFASSFEYRRCIVPCNSFYEWKALPGKNKKNKVEIALAEEKVMSLGGIFHRFQTSTGETKECFAILTTPAIPSLKEIHSRMPLIVNGREEAFLNPWTEKSKEEFTRPQEFYTFTKNTPCQEQNFIV